MRWMRHSRLLCLAVVVCASPLVRAEGERFDVQEFRVLGNTVLPTIEIERAVYPHLGPGRTLADVEQARQSLELAFRAAGYATVFVDIPEQSVDAGIVRLRVTEGRVDRVRISGARYFSQRRILAELPALRTGEVLHLPSVQQQLGAVNRETPNRAVTPVLKAGQHPGTVDVDLKVEDTAPASATLEVNDRYSADTSRLRAQASFTYANLFQRRHALGLQYQISPEEPDEVEVLVGTYTVPWSASGHAIVLSAIRSDTDVAALGTLAVLGKGDIFGLKSVWTLPAQGSWLQSLTAGLDYKDVEENVLLPDESGLSRPIDFVSWSLVHGTFRRGERTQFDSTLGAYFGVRGAANSYDEFNLKRFRATPNFFYLRGAARYDLAIWKGFELGARVSGQYSTTPLISNEQFAIGGADTVRGYLEADQLGDYGFAASLEVRSPSLFGQSPLAALQILGFADAGLVTLVDPLPGQVARFDLSSVGLGMRFSGFDGLEASLEWAYPLVPSVRVEAEDSRVHFSFRYTFQDQR